jgi:hypothetical protein
MWFYELFGKKLLQLIMSVLQLRDLFSLVCCDHSTLMESCDDIHLMTGSSTFIVKTWGNTCLLPTKAAISLNTRYRVASWVILAKNSALDKAFLVWKFKRDPVPVLGCYNESKHNILALVGKDRNKLEEFWFWFWFLKNNSDSIPDLVLKKLLDSSSKFQTQF